MIQYNAATDEIIVQAPKGVLCLRWDSFIEALERRISDSRYRPITEETRAQEARERGGR
jgi:hypothetical protein